ncbi:hypothetical protein PV-S19_0239 [Pacmanvirus S19]|nr:hypothetical protein PV-S19_0239 [Pacmanvirus S19]
MVQGYCLKEKKKVEIKEPKFELNKKGRPIARGKCASCGGTVYKILKSTEVPPELKAKIPKKGGASRRSRKSTGSKKSRKSAKRGSKKSRKSRKSKGSRKSRRSRR